MAIRRSVFPNGLTLITERVPEFRGLSMGIWVRVGTRHERPGEAGISHFLEHMLFKGTETRTALGIAREVDRVGGEFNAFTTREYTCFHLNLLSRDYALGIDILSDILLNSIFEASEMERERKVILQEIAMVEDTPEEIAHDLFFEQVYGRTGLGKSILGSLNRIRRLRRGDLLRFFRNYYRPEDIVFAVTGDVSHAEVLRRVRRLGRGIWPGRRRAAARRRAQKAPGFRRGTWWVKRKTEQAHIVWGVEGPRQQSRDRVAAYLLNTYLGGGMSSQLFQEIREKHGLAYTVYSSLSAFMDTGMMSIYVATSPAQVGTCLRLIDASIERLGSDLIEDEILAEVRDSVKGGLLLSDDNLEARMSSMGRAEVFGEPIFSVEELCRQVDAVTPQDIRRIARRYLRNSSRSLLVLGPSPGAQLRRKLKPKILLR
jgi:predicted Zn-dependent peptidase